MWSVLGRYRDFGLLVLRLGVGAMFLFHGWPKLMGGPVKWESLGTAMGYLGVHVIPVLWGMMAALSEFFGGACLILGVVFRPACLLLLGTMAVAATMHLQRGDGLQVASHAIELGFVFFGLLFIGPGRFGFGRG
ncbi:MAG: DoxX family protein [Trichloromonas sp.]|jgi:putative oxidoreductase|nr:DoxX family protein [Trichloromonas sp.]